MPQVIRIAVVRDGQQGSARTFRKGAIRIGRDPANDLVVGDRFVSRRHGEIRLSSEGVVYESCATTNATAVLRGGVVIPVDATSGGRVHLADGDELLFGSGGNRIHLQIRLIQEGDSGTTRPSALEFDVGNSIDVTLAEVVERLSASFDRIALLALHEHASSLAPEDDEATLMARFSATVLRVFGQANNVSIFEGGPAPGEFRLVYSSDRTGRSPVVALSRTVRDRVLDRREALTFTANDAGFDLSQSLKVHDVQAGMCAPMWNGSAITGLVQVDRRGTAVGGFDRRDLEVLVVLAKQLVLALQNARLQAGLRSTVRDLRKAQSEMEKLAFFDPLTGLANRRLLRDRLDQAVRGAQRGGQNVALMYLDLDNFKHVNDALGHDAGDALLRRVAAALKSCVRAQDTVARIGGDEFAIVLADVNGAEGARTVAQKILEMLRAPIALAGRDVVAGTSIGISLAPQDAGDAGDLLRNADAAMYRAKKHGRGHFQFHSGDMNERSAEQLRLEGELRGALARGEFVPHFQPIIALADGRIAGVETLVRWEHPGRGTLGPREFLPAAEQIGLGGDIAARVLADACAVMRRLQGADPARLRLSVNLSARQLRREGLPELLGAGLRECGIEPACLELDISERVLADNPEGGVARIRELKNLGVRLAVDDFGAGFSSLGLLRRVEIDTLKLDGSFVAGIPADPAAAQVAAAAIAMAHTLRMAVVAKNVESQAQAAFLREAGCDFAQGYLYAEALCESALQDWLRATAPSGG
ncbi:MAG: EAL domain-containing protein [Gammaproteobacteria bacterium]